MTGDDGSDFTPGDGRAAREGLGLLIARVARGDHGAFELVYEQLSGPVYRLILAVLRDAAQAEEVAQEVLLEIWRLAFRYDPVKGSAEVWVLTIARRRAIDRVRSAAAASVRDRRTATGRPADPVSGTAADTPGREFLHGCLGGLSDLQREAIVLAFYGEHTYAEVAGMLGVPLGTLKARIRDGLIKLRHCMQTEAAAPHQEAVHPRQKAAAAQLQATLTSRVLIEHASGILAERLQITPGEALVLLRRHAHAHHRPLVQVAGDVTRGTALIARGGPARSSPATRAEREHRPVRAEKRVQGCDQRSCTPGCRP
jgi:RNA polymerase sigma-70 factor, ECF subfamily